MDRDAGPSDELDHRLYTALASNIEPNAELLADLAIASAVERDDGRDGITYLIDTQRQGLETPLSKPYAQEVLRRTGTQTLEQALAVARRLAQNGER